SYGFVAHDDNSKEIIIGFRGSTTIMDWFKNAKFAQTSWPAQVPGSKVHIGFKDVYTSVATRVKSAVSDLIKKYPTYSIVLVGHSLGGAEATIAAADFVATNPAWAEKMWLFTYGQPRTGNDKFATWLNGRGFPIYRATYNADVVPMIPPRKLGYQHIAEEVHFPGSGSLMFCGKNPENPDCQLKVPTLKMSIKDHGRY
ncbi:alpha/beta-hydrolase, partial [Martensiomyces pterosporus]